MNDPAVDTASLETTALHGLHLELGARMVPFAGFDMPIQFAGVKAEHLHTRASAGLFDVSHMGVVDFDGEPDVVASLLESVMPTLLGTMKPGRQRYSMLTTESGGVVDDLMIARRSEGPTPFVAVINASRIAEDIDHLNTLLASPIAAGTISITLRRDLSILAIQGPHAVAAVAAQFDPATAAAIEAMAFMDVIEIDLLGARAHVSRSGYTGEDGVEIIVDSAVAGQFARNLLADERVEPIGLGARDTLRLEAGLCLYGNDLSTEISPIEADIGWAIPRRRRDEGGFPGAEVIGRHLSEGAPRRRVGLSPIGRRPVRDGAELFDPTTGALVGVVTSGGFGPSVDAPIAMGLVEVSAAGSTIDLTAVGTELHADVRGKTEPVVVAPLPFSPHRYQR